MSSENGGGSNLSIEQILQASDDAVEKVPVPEWGGHVFVRTISADERDTFELSFAEREDKRGMRAALVAAALCDETGTPQQTTPAQIQALGGKASGPLDRVFTAVMRLNKMQPNDIEEEAKN